MSETSPLLNTSTGATPRRFATVVLGGVAAVVIFAVIFFTVDPVKRPDSIFSPLVVRLYTHNIRYDNQGQRDVDEKPWSKRRDLVTSSIQWNTFNSNGNIVCLQEVLHNQLQDIVWNLNNENRTQDWTYYGVGRTDGLESGEYAPILYKSKEWHLVENHTFWLSETPEKPSRGWDAALERIVTMVTLQSRINPLIKLNFFNTHFDHKGVEARRESSKLIIDKMKNYNSYPSFLCGDFNTQPTDEPYHILKKNGFKDGRVLIDNLHHYGHFTTFTGFDRSNEVNTIIDYIWAPYLAENGNDQAPIDQESIPVWANMELHHNYKIKIKNFSILENFFSYYMSDHRPVSSDFEISSSLLQQ